MNPDSDKRKYAKLMRNRVYAHQLSTRGWKYRSFLRWLRVFRYISFMPQRGEFLESYYTLMRYIDDIVDGDTILPEGYSNAADFVLDKIAFSRVLKNPKDEVDYLMLYCYQVANQFGESFQQETEDILNSLLFDANRFGRNIFFPEEELMHHFHLLDVRGTIKGMLKIYNEDPEKYHFLSPLGIATRIHYDLQDFRADVDAGYINISEEDCIRFEIKMADILEDDSPAVRKWFIKQAEKGLELLEEHKRLLPQAKFRWFTRNTLPVIYGNPARKFFMQVLQNSNI